MNLNNIAACTSLAILGYFSASKNGFEENGLFGAILSTLPDVIAIPIYVSQTQGRWIIPMGIVAIYSFFRLRIGLLLLLNLIVSAGIGRTAALIVQDPPELLIQVGGKFLTEVVLVGILVLPIAFFFYLISYIVNLMRAKE